MVTSLTLNGNQDTSSTIAGSIADQLVSTQTGTTSSGVSTKIGTAFNAGGSWGQIYAKGNTGAWPGLGAIGAPDGNGWCDDSTFLELQQILAGNWQWIEKARITAGTATADMVVRYYKRSSGGVYTLIVSITLAAQAFTSTQATYTSAATAGLLTNFGLGDRAYKDVWFNCIANSGAGAGTSFAIQTCNNAGLGLSGVAQATTPGFQPIPTPSGSIEDRTLYKQQVVRVYDSSGNYRGLWPDAPLLTGFKTSINGGTTSLQVPLPRAFDNFGQVNFPGSDYTVAQGNIVEYTVYGPGLPNVGLLRYRGVIDKIEPSIDNPKEEVMVTLTHRSSVLGDRGASATVTFTGVDPITMFNYWFTTNDPQTGVPYAYPLTLDPSNPVSSGRTLTYTFVNQTLSSIFQTIMTMLPTNFFYRINMDNTVTLNQAPTTAQHIFYLGQHLTKPKYSQDWTGLKNFVVVNGKSPTTSTKIGTDLATFGQRLLFKSDTRLTDNTTCGIVAQGLLNLYDQVLFRSPITLVDYRGDAQPGLGVDIEAILPGDTIEIIDTTGPTSGTTWDNFTWDNAGWDYTAGALFNTVVSIQEITYNFDSIDIMVGAPAPNLSRALLGVMEAFGDFSMGQ